MTESLWFVAPVYHDSESFLLLRSRLIDAAGQVGDGCLRPVRFLVVDDSAGSDPDLARVHDLPDTTIVRSPFNLGHQRAIVYGLRTLLPALADSDIVVTLDSDGQDRPEDLPRMLAPLLGPEAGSRDVVLARRTKREETLAFKVWYLLFRVLFRGLTGVVIRTGNFAAYRGALARRLLPHPSFDLCYSSTWLTLDVQPRYVPCERGARLAGRSSMTTSRLLLHGLRMLMPFLDRIALRALLAFSVTFALSLVASTAIVTLRLFTDLAVPGWATSSLLLVVILSCMALGNFVILFAIFSQSRSISLSELELRTDESLGEPSPTSG